MSKLAKRPGLFWGCHAIGILTSVSQTAGFRFLEVLAACWPFQFLDPSHLCWWLRKVKNSQCVDINNITIIVIIIVIIIITCTVYRLSRSQKMPQYMHIYICIYTCTYIYHRTTVRDLQIVVTLKCLRYFYTFELTNTNQFVRTVQRNSNRPNDSVM